MLKGEPRLVTLETIAHLVGKGGCFSRASIAKEFNRPKSAWLNRKIEEAVNAGLIIKMPGYASGWRAAWVYCSPNEYHTLEMDFDRAAEMNGEGGQSA